MKSVGYPTVRGWRCSNMYIVDRRFLCKFFCCCLKILFVADIYLLFPKFRLERILLLKLKYWISKMSFDSLKYEHFRCSHSNSKIRMWCAKQNWFCEHKLKSKSKAGYQRNIKPRMASMLARVRAFHNILSS